MPRLLLCLMALTILACEDTSSRQIRFDRRSEFGRIFVVDEGDMRYLRFGSLHGSNQGTISLLDPNAVPMEYIRFAMLGMVLTPQAERVLMIGLGGGTFTTLLRRHFATLRIDAVEIDPVVVQAAKEYFGVQEDAHFRIHLEDGAAFIERTPLTYDLILLDAYAGEDMPEHLATQKFFEAVKSRLTSFGVAVLNLWDEGDKEPLIEKRFRTTFPETACVRTADGFNLILFGKASGTMPERENLVIAGGQFTSDLRLSFDLGKVAERCRPDCAMP